MCLTKFVNASNRWCVVGRDRFRKNKDGLLIGYKVLGGENESPFQIAAGFRWRVGTNYSSAHRRAKISDEYTPRDGQSGFHVLAKLSDARKALLTFKHWNPWAIVVPRHALKVIRVLVHPDDVKMQGTWEHNLAMICTKCTTDLEEL